MVTIVAMVFVIGLGASCAEAQGRARRAAAGPSAADRARAVALYEESSIAYRGGEFARAAALLEEAHALYPQAVLLYNLARAYESQGEYGRAISAYERYLADEPDTDDRGAIEARLVTLRQQVERERGVPAIVAPVTPPPAPDDTLEITGFSLLGLGGAGLVAGGVLSGLAASEHGTATSPDTTQRDAIDADARARSLGDAAVGLLIAGAVVAATGVVIVVVSNGDDGASGTASLRVGPTGVVLGGTF